LIRLDGVGHRYGNGTRALEGVTLDVRRGELLCLLGASGCGKSTLLRILAGLIAPSKGEVTWPAGRPRNIGFVFQDATLMPWSRALENAALPLRLHGVSRAEREARAGEALRAVGLAGFERALPRELSGGMRMRVSIARALVTRPSLLLMDEPFAALDEMTRARLNDDLLRLQSERGITVVFVTHSVFESAFLASRVVALAPRPGRVAAEILFPPATRDRRFRTSPAYAERCRAAGEALEATVPAGALA
jgi:NitT/TauT family transport system ATP-binding protein